MAATAEQRLDNRLKSMSNEQLNDCVREIGGGKLDADKWLVRVMLLNEFQRRHGDESLDAIMTEIGM